MSHLSRLVGHVRALRPTAVKYANNGATTVASMPHLRATALTAASLVRLENAPMTAIEALCAKPMRWLAVFHSRLVHVSEGRTINLAKLVALAFSFPVFEAHNFLFKLRYASN